MDGTAPLLRDGQRTENYSTMDTSALLESGEEENLNLCHRYRKHSLYLIYASAFVGTFSFSLYITSIWPYLAELDCSADVRFLGWIVMAYSVAQMTFSPIIGAWANKIGNVKKPIMVTLMLCSLGHAVYASLEAIPCSHDFHRKWAMMVARVIVGIGGGGSSLFRAYVAQATKVSERTHAQAIVSSCQALGTVLGPALQAYLTVLGKGGYSAPEVGIYLDMYSVPGWLAFTLSLANAALLYGCFKEFNITDDTQEEATPSCRTVALVVPTFRIHQDTTNNQENQENRNNQQVSNNLINDGQNISNNQGTPNNLLTNSQERSNNRDMSYNSFTNSQERSNNTLNNENQERSNSVSLSSQVNPPERFDPSVNECANDYILLTHSLCDQRISQCDVGRHVDKLAVATCIFIHFIAILLANTADTVATPLTMDLYLRSRKDAIQGVGMVLASGAVINFLVTLCVGPLSKRFKERKMLILLGIFPMALAFLLTLPAIHGKEDYTKSSALRSSASPSQDMLFSVSFTSAPHSLQMILAYFLLNIGYAVINPLNFSLYSKVLGPQKQGFAMGMMTSAASLSRTCAPLVVGQVYTRFGHQVLFGCLGALSALTLMLLMVVSHRLVPWQRRGCSDVIITRENLTSAPISPTSHT